MCSSIFICFFADIGRNKSRDSFQQITAAVCTNKWSIVLHGESVYWTGIMSACNPYAMMYPYFYYLSIICKMFHDVSILLLFIQGLQDVPWYIRTFYYSSIICKTSPIPHPIKPMQMNVGLYIVQAVYVSDAIFLKMSLIHRNYSDFLVIKYRIYYTCFNMVSDVIKYICKHCNTTIHIFDEKIGVVFRDSR